jgi:hypothetical protein
VGWSFAAGAPASRERALFCVTALDTAPTDLGMRTELAEVEPNVNEAAPVGAMKQAS